MSEKRLSLLSNGHVRYELKTPYRDGTTHVIFEPLDFSRSRHPASRDISASVHVIARLVALVPKPRVTSLDSKVCSRPTMHIVRR